ncbi:MAG: type II toxin-antitoxin system RelE/ParE family toxin [Lachnospiraceae bacterium]|nr:type II toxin-antitoxin system RelE/ParE family toxin [Lachnospiraceae bacterium]
MYINSLCDDEQLSAKGIRKYRIKKYIVYYVIDEASNVVNMLRVRHALQDENKFFNN